MVRITDQYFWNLIFALFFLTLIVLGAIILEGDTYKSIHDVTLIDMVLISLATFRTIRLFVYDAITKFFREQFWDAKEMKSKVVLSKPVGGPRRTIADLLSCPWCFGMWAAAMMTFFYFLTPYAFYVVLFFAIAGVATLLQLFANMIGWQAEKGKREAGG